VSDTYTLGQAVTFTRHLVRRTAGSQYGHPDGWVKRWETTTPAGVTPAEPRHGVVVGVRTLVDGTNVNHGYEGGIVFRPVRYYSAYLVAFDLRRRPVYVLPDHLTPTGAHP
jgi:hypothetical protein